MEKKKTTFAVCLGLLLGTLHTSAGVYLDRTETVTRTWTAEEMVKDWAPYYPSMSNSYKVWEWRAATGAASEYMMHSNMLLYRRTTLENTICLMTTFPEMRDAGKCTISDFQIEVSSDFAINTDLKRPQPMGMVADTAVYIAFKATIPYTDNMATEDDQYYADIPIKSVSVTYTRHVYEHLHWSDTQVTATLGETFKAPPLNGVPEHVTYRSSRPEVACVTRTGQVLPISVGETIITARDEQDGDETSYVLNVVFPASTTGTDETITLTEAGTLRDVTAELETSRIRCLKLSGPVNGDDLAYLRSATGRLSELEELDLSDIVPVAGDVSYASRSVKSDIGGGNTTYYYYISDEDRTTTSSVPTGLGGAYVTVNVYTTRLDALFINMSTLRRAVLPKCLKGIGEFTFWGCEELLSLHLLDNISFVHQNAFANCKKLLSVNLPQSVTELAGNAFQGCASLVNLGNTSNLKSLETNAFKGCTQLIGNVADMTLDLSGVDSIPESAFSGCVLLQDIRFSKNLRYIGKSAFYGFERNIGLTSLVFPESLEEIGYEAFRNCQNLTTVVVPSTLYRLGYISFYDTPYLNNLEPEDDGIYYIGNVAIGRRNDNSDLTFREGTLGIGDNFTYLSKGIKVVNVNSVTFPSTLRRIGDYAFSGSNYKTYTSITIPEGVVEISMYAFSNNSQLETVSMPSTLKHIGSYAFYGNTSLSTVTIPEELEEIGWVSFGKCTGLATVLFNARHATYTIEPDEKELVNGQYYPQIFYKCTGLDKLVVGPKVTQLPKGLCYQCDGLLKVEFAERAAGDTLRIQMQAFYECPTLSRMDIPDGLTAIEDKAFYGCTGIKSINWGTKLCEIGESAFYKCTSLTEVSLPASVQHIGEKAFTQSGVQTIHLPEGMDLLEWSTFYQCQDVKNVFLPSTMDSICGDALVFETKNTEHTFDIYCSAIVPPIFHTTEAISGGGNVIFKRGGMFQPNLTGCRLYVPEVSIEDYKAADGWKNFDIYSLEETGVHDIQAEKEASTTIWYGLHGQRYDSRPVQSGLYIRNDKKILVR